MHSAVIVGIGLTLDAIGVMLVLLGEQRDLKSWKVSGTALVLVTLAPILLLSAGASPSSSENPRIAIANPTQIIPPPRPTPPPTTGPSLSAAPSADTVWGPAWIR